MQEAAANCMGVIEAAFRHRRVPHVAVVSEQLAGHEAADLQAFLGKAWDEITCDELEAHFEAIHWMPPEVFLSFLPGVMLASLREQRPELIMADSVIGWLDRSPDRDLWDDFFVARWSALSREECEAVQCWVLWLSSLDNPPFRQDSLSRAFDTLALLKEGAPAGPE